MSSRYLIVTDGQTDGQTKAISIPRYALVHSAVKMYKFKKSIKCMHSPYKRLRWVTATLIQVGTVCARGTIYPTCGSS